MTCLNHLDVLAPYGGKPAINRWTLLRVVLTPISASRFAIRWYPYPSRWSRKAVAKAVSGMLRRLPRLVTGSINPPPIETFPKSHRGANLQLRWQLNYYARRSASPTGKADSRHIPGTKAIGRNCHKRLPEYPGC